MSLRDLATTSLCAPNNNASSAVAGSSSSNPLVQLAEAVIPGSAQGQLLTSERTGSSSASRENPDDDVLRTFPQDVIDRRHEQIPELINISAPTLPSDLFIPYVPPTMSVAPPPVPMPVEGDPTDVFERAFKSAAPPISVLPRASLLPPGQFSHPPRNAVNDLHMLPTPGIQLPWHDLSSKFASLALRSTPSHAPQLHFPPYNPVPVVPSIVPYATQAQSHTPVLQQKIHTDTISNNEASASAAQIADALPKTELRVEDIEKSNDLLRSTSWGEEFTSLETVISPLQGFNDVEGFLFDDTLQTAFQHWLRRDASESYQFHNESKGASSATNALKEGVRAHNEGRLSAAVYYLENALNRNGEADVLPISKRALAWYVLGLSLADLDDDERAIQALAQGLRQYDGSQVGHRREDNPYLWQSLIALAVSYTNELEHTKALRVIREWMELRSAVDHGDSEAGIVSSLENVDLFRRSDHDDLTSRLNRIANDAPHDPDVFIVLGILHNLNRDYTSAAVSFRHAVSLRPNVPNLWNKLGATLANGGQNEDALRAYRKAVDLQPALVRAWVNVGTAYSNQGEFFKAIRYYLKAIVISQESADDKGHSLGLAGDESMLHVWGYLRSTLIAMSRSDLLHLVESRDAVALRAHFNF